MPKILVVDDEPQIRRILALMLVDAGFDVVEVETGEEGAARCREADFDLALVDMSLPGMDGLATLRELLVHDKSIDCIMMTAYGTIRSAVEAMRIGAFDYLAKPFDNNELLLIINRALELRRLSREVEELRGELSTRYGFNEIVGISPGLQGVFRTMVKVASVDATVLIEGQSGTGKELVARAIHRRSHRAKGPFIALNCGAIPQGLFEAEVFGYERGAFTGAHTSRPGRFEQAHRGTLFLDEVGELPIDAQVKLLRVLQDHEVTRLGGGAPVKVDVRVIVASNTDLKQAVEHARFREDLYWRLNVVKISLPSLRERREDIPLIIDHFLDRFNNELGLAVASMSSEARRLLEAAEWPGNVRDLENAVCSAMIMCEGGIVTVRDLPPRVRGELADALVGRPPHDITKLTLSEAVKEVSERAERMMIISRLAQMNGNRTATAESLGISRKTLFNKMRQFGMGADETEVGG